MPLAISAIGLSIGCDRNKMEWCGWDAGSLEREVEFLRSISREHNAELRDRDEKLHKCRQRAEKTDQAMATLKRARYELQDSLRVKNDRIETLGLETGQLQRELQLTRKENHASKERIREVEVDLEEALLTRTSANLRIKIKKLCVKYHPDRAGHTMLSSTAVARDLIELLTE